MKHLPDCHHSKENPNGVKCRCICSCPRNESMTPTHKNWEDTFYSRFKPFFQSLTEIWVKLLPDNGEIDVLVPQRKMVEIESFISQTLQDQLDEVEKVMTDKVMDDSTDEKTKSGFKLAVSMLVSELRKMKQK